MCHFPRCEYHINSAWPPCRVGLAKGRDKKNASLNVPEHSKGCVGEHACQSQARVCYSTCMEAKVHACQSQLCMRHNTCGEAMHVPQHMWGSQRPIMEWDVTFHLWVSSSGLHKHRDSLIQFAHTPVAWTQAWQPHPGLDKLYHKTNSHPRSGSVSVAVRIVRNLTSPCWFPHL